MMVLRAFGVEAVEDGLDGEGALHLGPIEFVKGAADDFDRELPVQKGFRGLPWRGI